MKIFPSSSIKKLDAYTIEHEPIASIDLMERAATALTKAIMNRWSRETPVTVFAGPGNNGGDALAVARMLSEKGYKTEVYLFNPKGELSPDCQTNKELVEMAEEVTFHEISTQFVPPTLTPDHLVIDGLFGSGLNKPLSGGFAAVVKYINSSPAMVVAIDIPSGLMGEENTFNVKNNIIRADVTFSLQLPKLAFLFAENTEYVGEWDLLNIGLSEEGIEETETNYEMLELEDIRSLIKPRQQFAHKGNFGHALLIAGSKGMAGASVLAARACLRSGVGLLTVHAPICNNDILQTSVPEAMVETDANETCFAIPTDTDDYQAVGIGPGLGRSEETEAALLAIFVRLPASRAMLLISTMPSATSETSDSKRRFTSSGWVRDTMTFGPLVVFFTSRTYTFTRWVGSNFSPLTCSFSVSRASTLPRLMLTLRPT